MAARLGHVAPRLERQPAGAGRTTPPEQLHPILQLQRTAGNRASTAFVQRLEFERSWSGSVAGALTAGYRRDVDADRWRKAFGELDELMNTVEIDIIGASGVRDLDDELAPIRKFLDAYRSANVGHRQRQEVGGAIDAHLRTLQGLVPLAKQLAAKAEAAADAARAAERKKKVDEKLAAHANRIAAQQSEYDASGPAPSVLHVAPHDFKTDGHGGHGLSTAGYAKKTGESHYMAGLALDPKRYADRMAFEDQEKAQGARAHSGGWFEQKYTDAERASFDPTKDAGTAATKGTDQVFHPGKHNPWQSEAALSRRLTHGTTSDTPLGAATDLSSKFLSDAVAVEAIAAAKAWASTKLAATPASYQSGGKFYRAWSVLIDLGKTTGTGVKGTGGRIAEHTDNFGGRSVQGPVEAKARLLGLSELEAKAVARAAVASIPAGDQAAKVARASVVAAAGPGGASNNAINNAVKNALIAAVTAQLASMVSPSHADALARVVEQKSNRVFDKSEIAPVAAGAITAAKVGISLLSINPDGTNATWNEGASQLFPAATVAAPTMTRYGNDLMP